MEETEDAISDSSQPWLRDTNQMIQRQEKPRCISKTSLEMHAQRQQGLIEDRVRGTETHGWEWAVEY